MTDNTREIETALWYNANECKDPVAAYKDSIEEAVNHLCQSKNAVSGDINCEILEPGDPRVPDVPKWLANVKDVVPRLLVIRISVVEAQMIVSQGIIGDLDEKDVKRLRVLTRRAHNKRNPDAEPLTNAECDEIIDELGMDTILEQLRSHTIH